MTNCVQKQPLVIFMCKERKLTALAESLRNVCRGVVSLFSKVADQEPTSLLKRYFFCSYFSRILLVHFQTYWEYLLFGAHFWVASSSVWHCTGSNARIDNVVWKFVLSKAAYFCLFLLFWEIYFAPHFILIF